MAGRRAAHRAETCIIPKLVTATRRYSSGRFVDRWFAPVPCNLISLSALHLPRFRPDPAIAAPERMANLNFRGNHS